jgi:hypothetical protein
VLCHNSYIVILMHQEVTHKGMPDVSAAVVEELSSNLPNIFYCSNWSHSIIENKTGINIWNDSIQNHIQILTAKGSKFAFVPLLQ